MLNSTKPPINWPAMLMLTITPVACFILIPLYAYFYDFSPAAWVSFVLLLAWSGLGITAGYHRLWSHLTYTARLPVKLFLMVGGTLAIQNSALFWSSGHRLHHRHVDDVRLDPYSAKRGFWFSHMGWMLRNYTSGLTDYSNVPDLLKDKLVMFQHNYYLACIFVTNVLMIAAIGWAVGDIWGVLLLGGLLRLVVNHHCTFFINSAAHVFGKQPYTDENTARDNFWLALVTWGEGYHNYHHIFQADYRNGVKWWQFDPTKWLILAFRSIGLVSNLKSVPEFTIRKAEAAMTFKRAQQSLNNHNQSLLDDLDALKARLMQEYEAFTQTVSEWTQLREKSFELKKEAIAQKFSEVDARFKAEFKAKELRMQAHANVMKEMLMSIHKMLKVKVA